MRRSLRALCMLLLSALSACAPLAQRADRYEKPRVAILAFENKASLADRWNLSEGMRDILVDSLVRTDRYTVLTRGDLGAVLSELDIQREPYFRAQGKVQQGQLKNVRYLIKGAVTDFTHVRGGALRVAGSHLGLGISGEVAVVSVTLYVIDVENGEIVASKTLEGTASAGSAGFDAAYRDVAVGGKAFFRTPLGKATRKVMDRCLDYIARTIASEPWHPAVVKVDGARLVISGGEDRHLAPGSHWTTYEEGEPLVDPRTGDLLGREPGTYAGRIRVTEVHDRYSTAEVVEGTFREGQELRPER